MLTPENDIQYYTNSTILTDIVTAYNIYVGDFSSTPSLQRTQELLDYFASNLGESSWFSIITSYYQINSKTNKKTYASGKLNFGGSVNIFSEDVALSLTELDLIDALIYLLNNRFFPVNTQAVYTFILRGDTVYDGWLSKWCGYHFGILLNDGRILNLSIIADPGSVQKGKDPCACVAMWANTANGNMGADNMAQVYAHEVVEVITNFNGAWHFENNVENADACGWTFGKVDGNSNVQIGQKRFLIQQNWQPKVGCTLTKQ